MEIGVVDLFRVGKVAVAALGAVWATWIFQWTTSVDLLEVLEQTKQLLRPPYIYLFFNLILFFTLSYSYWVSKFSSLLNKIQKSFFKSQPPLDSSSTVTVQPLDQAIIGYLADHHHHTYYYCYNYPSPPNFDHQIDAADDEAMQKAPIPAASSTGDQSVPPLGPVNRQIYLDKDGFNPENLLDKHEDKGDPEEKRTEQAIGSAGDEDEDDEGEGDDMDEDDEDEGDDMNSTWNAIMGAKNNNNNNNKTMELEEEDSRKNEEGLGVPLEISAKQSWNRSVKAAELKQSWNCLQEGVGVGVGGVGVGVGVGVGEVGRIWSNRGRVLGVVGWRKKMEEVAVASHDELYHRAEAFISKFKLQRLDSYQRFLDMINGGRPPRQDKPFS